MRDGASDGGSGRGEHDEGEGLPPMVPVAVERRDAMAVTLARVERGEIVLLEERGEDVAAVVPRELAALLVEIAGEVEDGAVGDRLAAAHGPRDPDGAGGERRGGPGAPGATPVEVSFTDLGVDADAWTA